MRQPLFAALACLASLAAHAAPVIPGAAGFGIETAAGRGGTVYRVTTLAASGPGSLKACVEASGPRVCVFEVSGTIRTTEDLHIRNGNITIAGQTAPSPGIQIRGAGMIIWASDVLVQHIRIRPGDDLNGPPAHNRDALSIGDTVQSRNIVIDHVSMSWSTDETASSYWNWDAITFRYVIFGPPLHDSIHPVNEGGPNGAVGVKHGYGPLFQLVGASHPAQLAIIGSLMLHQYARNPLTLAPRFAFVNNVVYNAVDRQTDLQSSGQPTYNSVVGNVYIKGPDSGGVHKPIIAGGVGESPLPSGSRLYVADNLAAETTSDPWSVVNAATTRSSLEVSSPPAWPTGLVALKTANNGVLNHVIANVGARPADRDSYDRSLITQVQNKTGSLINCVSSDGSTRCQKNAGGWPQLAENKRTLALPANPNQINPDGYTNLEKWLHAMSAEVEGGPIVPQTPPATSPANPRAPTNLRVE